MRHVYWPSALSWMFSSLHTSVGFAVVGAVVGEYLGSAAGLGYLIQQAEGVFDVAGVFAGMFVLAAFVIVIDTIVTLVEKRLLVWRPLGGRRQALGSSAALAYRPRRNGLLKGRKSGRNVMPAAIPAARHHARRASAVVGPRARAIQGDARHRRRLVPVLSADHAGQSARRIQEGRRRCRRGHLQGRLGVAQGRDRRQRRRGVRLFRPLRQSRRQGPASAGLRGLRPLPRLRAGGVAQAHDRDQVGQGPRQQEGRRQRARLVHRLLPQISAEQERRRSELGRRHRRRPRRFGGRGDGAGRDRCRRHARSGGDHARKTNTAT